MRIPEGELPASVGFNQDFSQWIMKVENVSKVEVAGREEEISEEQYPESKQSERVVGVGFGKESRASACEVFECLHVDETFGRCNPSVSRGLGDSSSIWHLGGGFLNSHRKGAKAQRTTAHV
jgi:hypothetical protein